MKNCNAGIVQHCSSSTFRSQCLLFVETLESEELAFGNPRRTQMDPFKAPTEFEQDIENADMTFNGGLQEDSVLRSNLTECRKDHIHSQEKVTDSSSYHSLPEREQVRSSEKNVAHQFDIETDDAIQAKTIYDNIIQSSEFDSKTELTFEEFCNHLQLAWS